VNRPEADISDAGAKSLPCGLCPSPDAFKLPDECSKAWRATLKLVAQAEGCNQPRLVLSIGRIPQLLIVSAAAPSATVMPVKIARSTPRPSFGLPELLVAPSTPRVWLPGMLQNRYYPR
jgi:hypothetical protein